MVAWKPSISVSEVISFNAADHARREWTECRFLMQPDQMPRKNANFAGSADDFVLASIALVNMSVKADKTFEEVVERLVALVRWRPHIGGAYETLVETAVVIDSPALANQALTPQKDQK
jgi:hypothetical protein